MTLTFPAGSSTNPEAGSSPAGLWLEVDGRGPDLVLVHGALGDYRQWTPIAQRLREQFRVVAVSRRYHWPNQPPPSDAEYDYEIHCGDLLAHLRRYERPVHLVGHSYGAGIALLAALRAPAAIETLTLIEPPFASLLPAPTPELDREVASRASMLESVRTLAQNGSDEHAARMLVDWLQGGSGGFAALAQDARAVLLQNARTVGPAFSRAAPAVTCEQLRELHVPTLVLAGERTRVYFALIARTTAACLPHATTASIPGAGHMTIVERPADTAALLLEFLGRTAARS